MSQQTIRNFFKPKIENNLKSPHAEDNKTIVKIRPSRGQESKDPNYEVHVSKTRKRKRAFSSSDEDGENTAHENSTQLEKVASIKAEDSDNSSDSNKDVLCKKNKTEVNSSNISTPQSLSECKTMCMIKEVPNNKNINYNPHHEDYDPINGAFWRKNKETPYMALVKTFELIEEIRGRIKMIEVLGNFFCSVILLHPQDLLPCIYLSINQIGPTFEGSEMGVAETTLMKVICKATGRDMKQIKVHTNTTGDLGLVAEQSRVAQKMMFQPSPLTVQGIFKKMVHISKLTGKAKVDIIQNIFVACRQVEARYFVRSLIGKLRIGIAEQSLLQSLAYALVKSKSISNKKTIMNFKKQVEDTAHILKTVYCQCPNYDKIVPKLLKHDITELADLCPMETGVPLKPMLAQPTKGVGEVLQRLDGLDITCEWKYDGERAQIHCNEKGEIKIFSRNQEDNTSKYPDLISRVNEFKKNSVTSYIVDSEVVAWDIENKSILPFQILSTRKRKNVEVNDIKVQVCVYVFDLLYFNGKPLVTCPFKERRQLLKENFNEVPGHWQFAIARDTNDIDEIQQFLEESVKGNCEGLMVKTLDIEATYEIARRSRNWLKLKKDYLSGVGDSLDLVVIGGYKGKGKRTGQYGGFLLASYDNQNEEYQSICKIGTGFSEEDLKTHTSFFQNHILDSPKSYYCWDNSLEPDDWFEPIQVWEVKCADLSLSPVHKAAIGIIDPERGISLRFPRFIRIREDKSPENASSSQQVADMYSSQDQIKNQQSNSSVNHFDTDFY